MAHIILEKSFLSELQNRLKTGNRRGVHLNAIPGKARLKLDLHRLSEISPTLPDDFLQTLLTRKKFRFPLSFQERMQAPEMLSDEDQMRLVKLSKAFENLIGASETIASEKGTNAFGFGYPIISRRDRKDGKVTVAPLLIWHLRLQRTRQFDTWEILRSEDDPIYLNEVLQNHLLEDSGVTIDSIPETMREDGIIDAAELAQICNDFLQKVNGGKAGDFPTQPLAVTAIDDAKFYEQIPRNPPLTRIEAGGLFSIFEVQKQSIIDDYTTLISAGGQQLLSDDLAGNVFQSLSSVDTDPTQQGVLHALEDKRNILIQGPPGTGKSQTLTAVLLNALENGKKALVVCEKRTALEVLHEALKARGLGPHCVLIRDASQDRQMVVRSVRDRIDAAQSSSQKGDDTAMLKSTLDRLTLRARAAISGINATHQKLSERLIGDKNRTWLTGEFLAAETQPETGTGDVTLPNILFAYTEEELAGLLQMIAKGETLYGAYAAVEDRDFLNGARLTGDNPYPIEAAMKADFAAYEKTFADVQKLLSTSREEYFSFRRKAFAEEEQKVEKRVAEILGREKIFEDLCAQAKDTFSQTRKEIAAAELQITGAAVGELKAAFEATSAFPDALEEARVNGFMYRLGALFSGNKKQSIHHHKVISEKLSSLQNRLAQAQFLKLAMPEGSLSQKQSALPAMEAALLETSRNSESETQRAFAALGLENLLQKERGHLDVFAQQKESAPEALRPVLHQIQNQFETFLANTQTLLVQLQELLSTQRDLKIPVSFIGKSYAESRVLLKGLGAKAELIALGLEAKMAGEFEALQLLSSSAQEGMAHLPELQTTVAQLREKFRKDQWTHTALPNGDLSLFLSALQGLLARTKAFLDGEKDAFLPAFEWHSFYNHLPPEKQQILDALRSGNQWQTRFTRAYLNGLLAQSASTILTKDAAAYEDLNSALEAIRPEQLKFIQKDWPHRQQQSTQRFEKENGGLLVRNLYNLRSTATNARKSLRQIVEKDLDLFTTFFPVVLTSPEVASLLFRGRNGYFDLVIFDEASQLRLEENIPSVLKGKQVIIAGDEHQMPPSDVFKTRRTNQPTDGTAQDEEDEDWDAEGPEETAETEPALTMDATQQEVLLSCDSLLDFGAELSFHKRYLDFHYRSRHPHLIDFSNHAFYNRRLKPLPNTLDYVPMKYIPVNGTFVNRTNEAEAEVVLSLLEHTIQRLPGGKYPTVGVATFNGDQRDFIKAKINDRRKHERYSAFNAKIEELEAAGFFVKNLENIQGDERDVIILSTTYGKKPDGSFTQNFGPVNHSKGYKLLNVIVTRAKYKVYCCCSIPENYLLNYRDYLATEGNNKKAALYAYLAYCKAVSEGNGEARQAVLQALSENGSKGVSADTEHLGLLESPFEEEVYQRLVARVGAARITLQQAFAGFRIDLVYHSAKPGVPPIAIECDGAKYHSSREAYLHDRHRQRILEGHGFVFHRIWSTHWWRNSNRELEALLRFIEAQEARAEAPRQADDTTETAFGHEVVLPTETLPQTALSEDAQTAQMVLSPDEKTEAPQAAAVSGKTAPGSVVRIRYVRSGKAVTVKLTGQPEDADKMVDGVQQVYLQSPLGMALLGHGAGTIVKVGELDHFVEILEVDGLSPGYLGLSPGPSPEERGDAL